MGRYLINPRRVARVPVRLRVRVGFAGSEFAAETRDLGSGGCLMVAPRVIAPGVPLRLIIEDDALPELLRVTGGAVWGAQDDRSRVGVAFGPNQVNDPVAWFRRFLEKNPAIAGRLARVPASLDDRTSLYLLEPPALDEIRPEELAVLSGFVDGITVGELLEGAPDRSRERARAIFALLEKRVLTISPRAREQADRAPTAGGRPTQPRAAPPMLQASPPTLQAPPTELRVSPPTLSRHPSPESPVIFRPVAGLPLPGVRSSAAQVEFEVGRRLGSIGRYSEALTHLRQALILSPRDPGIAVLIGEYAFKDRRVD